MRILILLVGTVLLFFSCSEKQSVTDVSAHPTEWMEADANNFHGSYVIENTSVSCESCHGEMLDGGSSQTSCFGCHALYPHSEEIVVINSPEFHGTYIKNNGWDMTACQSCHGNSFNLPSTDKSCLVCHTSPGGPIACNTCHGSMENNAPPRDLDGNLTTDAPGVGAHQLHLSAMQFTENISCDNCHIVDYDYYADTHIDGDDQAEIEFGGLALLSGEAAYSASNQTCSNIYCHGNFIFYVDSSEYQWAYNTDITGNNPDVVWNVVDGSQLACGDCHGLPPSGHKPYAGQPCYYCHSNVVDENNHIIDKTLHINGEANIDLDGKAMFH